MHAHNNEKQRHEIRGKKTRRTPGTTGLGPCLPRGKSQSNRSGQAPLLDARNVKGHRLVPFFCPCSHDTFTRCAKLASHCLLFIMRELANVDLRTDPAALEFIKDEVVGIVFAAADGELHSREGMNRFHIGDALVTGSTGDQWSVSRDRFYTKYEPATTTTEGADGKYRSKPVPVLARQMSVPFTIARTSGGDRLHGSAYDWLLQYAPGDYGVVENTRFQQVYRQLKP